MVSRDFLNGSLSEVKDEIKNQLLQRMTRAARRGV